MTNEQSKGRDGGDELGARLADQPTVAGFPEKRGDGRKALALDLPNAAHEVPEERPEGRSGGQDRFVVQEEIGRGGLASVELAFDQDLRRHVALKRLIHDLPGAAAVLRREAQVTAQIEHPNVPAVHSLEMDAAGKPYFTMTLVEGRCLADLLSEEGPLPVQRALRIFLQVGYAVAYAHYRGVIHRDIKPQNVVLGKFGEVRLIDWGLAKVRTADDGTNASPDGSRVDVVGDGDLERTTAGTVKGTPGYMSPEQASGEVDIDERSDIYGLGALLYRMVAGRKPVEADSLVESVVATKQGRVTPLGEVADVPIQLQAVVHQALALNREDRYASVEAFISDILAFMDGKPVAAAQENLGQKAMRVYFSPLDRWRLRFVDVDMMCGTTTFWSFAVGLALAVVLGRWRIPLLLLALLVGLLMIIPVVVHMRKVREEDEQNRMGKSLTPGAVETSMGSGRSKSSSKQGSGSRQTGPGSGGSSK